MTTPDPGRGHPMTETACCPDCTTAGRTGLDRVRHHIRLACEFAAGARSHANAAIQHAADVRRHADRARRAVWVAAVALAVALTSALILAVATLS